MGTKLLIQDIITIKKKVGEASRELKTVEKIADKIEKRGREEKINDLLSKKPVMNFPKMPKIKIPRLKFFLIVIACVFFALIGIFLLNKISSVRVEITPRQAFADINAVFKASLEPKKNELPLEIMRTEHSERQTAAATGIKSVSRKASGQIIIYNAYSSQPQMLIEGTRFEATGNKKIYRINKTIIVPGAKIENGKIIPSSIEATIFGDEPGEEYNTDLTDFTIPGFKDPEKHAKFYGRSKTKIENGMVGEIHFITEKDISYLQSILEAKTKDYLLKTSTAQKPSDFLLYDNAKQINLSDQNMPKPETEASQFELEIKGVLVGFLLKRDDISRILIEKYLNLSETAAAGVEIINLDQLDFEAKNISQDSITFAFKDRVRFGWKIDEKNLKNDLINQGKNPESVFKNYPAIEKAKIYFKPDWWHFFPNNPSKITIEKTYQN